MVCHDLSAVSFCGQRSGFSVTDKIEVQYPEMSAEFVELVLPAYGRTGQPVNQDQPRGPFSGPVTS